MVFLFNAFPTVQTIMEPINKYHNIQVINILVFSLALKHHEYVYIICTYVGSGSVLFLGCWPVQMARGPTHITHRYCQGPR